MTLLMEKKEEENAFNAMIDLYIMYKCDEMSEDMLEKMNQINENWIKHCETQLVEMGLEYYQLKSLYGRETDFI